MNPENFLVFLVEIIFSLLSPGRARLNTIKVQYLNDVKIILSVAFKKEGILLMFIRGMNLCDGFRAVKQQTSLIYPKIINK